MWPIRNKQRWRCAVAGVVFLAAGATAPGDTDRPARGDGEAAAVRGVLDAKLRKDVDRGIDGAIVWLAGQQRPDGSFPTIEIGQPAVTALCVLAFLAKGHVPGAGPDAERINAGIDYVLSCARPNGLIARVPPGPTLTAGHTAEHTAIYNHAIGGLLLCEVNGMTDEAGSRAIRKAIKKAVAFSRERQQVPKRDPAYKGGWRYVRPWKDSQADVSVTAWQIMFLRSAENAGVSIPKQYVDEAVAYVKRSFDERNGSFLYGMTGPERRITRSMAGAGILTLQLAGRHDSTEARSAGDWILRHPFSRYNVGAGPGDRFHYGAYYCSQAMFQLGGRHWRQFYPVLARTLLAGQAPDGSWRPESYPGDERYGSAYTTALSALALATPYQLLPIYQR